MKEVSPEKKIIAGNPKAKHDYTIIDTLECGIALVGTEVKSIRNKNVNIKDSYVQIKDGELYIMNMHISPYDEGIFSNVNPLRTRKLLANKRQINKLWAMCKEKGVTLVPLSVYFVKNLVKVEVATAKGKKIYDKRQDIAKKEALRRIQRAIN
jgi:SsrA-binding protein